MVEENIKSDLIYSYYQRIIDDMNDVINTQDKEKEIADKTEIIVSVAMLLLKTSKLLFDQNIELKKAWEKPYNNGLEDFKIKYD